ncbi:MAG: Na+/H+ antiporter NhaA [Phenylobacterium sp.]|uniref:Na+/H+ antiporter NhaA n=1 Tax=Phenylobacterium sp. TaxID=1871053 RepID=UPI001B44DEE1|nr:Na+/H+ antiporter NhaA [Phenylobacterium sp.]MBP6547084.1 Na+/H+ antiporter NhaA [Phenylobacterium sp.]MBP7816007.1 Na+/H+ antiporter NhaA [Phenylobacterium sp.]MBP9755542.1 Na+/H+ antiporter NhaA [Phenylobacterium sp.]
MTSTHRRPSVLRSFFQAEAAGGLILMGLAGLALVVANSPLSHAYFAALHAPVAGLDVLHWINDGLMAVFFLLVGLEIKREVVDGELSTWPRRILPGVAAAGGMLVPALVYLAFQGGDPVTMHGWAIPAATDIAFALGILSLLGKRVPVSLKVFLTALAIIDDLGAVLIIAFFYTSDLALWALAGAAVALAVLIAMNRMKVAALTPYLVVGAVLWWLTLQSGVHATLAGVALALTIPLRRSLAAPDDALSPLHRLEHAIQPWVAFAVVPIFGFANAGVSFAGLSFSDLLAPVPLGVAAGLFLGKQMGVFGSVWLLVRLGWAERPARATWRQVYGVSVLCGIGFTMSLFIGLLAFDSPELQEATKLGVLAGSLLSAILGWAILRKAPALSRGSQAS